MDPRIQAYFEDVLFGKRIAVSTPDGIKYVSKERYEQIVEERRKQEEQPKYAVFEFDSYYPDGGAYDFKYFIKAPIEEIKENYRKMRQHKHQDDFYVQIVDAKTMEIVCQGKFTLSEAWDWDDTWRCDEEH